MPPLNIGALRAVANNLDPLELNYAFTGGAVVNLLLDDPEMGPARPTDDVDVIVEVVSDEFYAGIEKALREAGFENDIYGPLCRWRLGSLVVDIMPTSGDRYGLNSQWFPEALETAGIVEYGHTKLRIVSPIGFLTTKYLTFIERGEGDFHGSHDLEDFITVIDGRDSIVDEIDTSRKDFRDYLIGGMRTLLSESDFQEALPGFLRGDWASQARLPLLRTKLQQIEALGD
tara:strand:- start:8710 stop:9399 length:690 start_codon:yes stop_codon:yes gene_type:complete